MARKEKPYLPLYVQDFLTDEKLIECSAQAHGVYIRLMCIFHKQEQYGKILLKQTDKQSIKQIENFATKLCKQMPFTNDVISSALNELLDNNVIQLNDDILSQKRMVDDSDLSDKRSKSGCEGGKTTQKFAKAKRQANADNESEIEVEVKKPKKEFIPPTLDEVKQFFKERGYNEQTAIKAFNCYDLADWHNSHGKKVLNWKQTMNNNWFKDENKLPIKPVETDPMKIFPTMYR
jgi:uncharacterized protein YdaU (DUF1376 family)